MGLWWEWLPSDFDPTVEIRWRGEFRVLNARVAMAVGFASNGAEGLGF